MIDDFLNLVLRPRRLPLFAARGRQVQLNVVQNRARERFIHGYSLMGVVANYACRARIRSSDCLAAAGTIEAQGYAARVE